MSKFVQIKPCDVIIDPSYQRDFDEKRSQAMASNIDMDRIGVPVVSIRRDGSIAGVDGQHRVRALCIAGLGDVPVLCEAHEGLTIKQEATLFLKLNAGRLAVRAYDKFRARLTAKERVAIDINKIVEAAGLKVAKASGTKYVCAVQAMESVYHRSNLSRTLKTLSAWCDNDSRVFDGELIKSVGAFYAEHPDAVDADFVRRLATFPPERVLSKFRAMMRLDPDMQKSVARVVVLREIYNKGARNKLTATNTTLKVA